MARLLLSLLMLACCRLSASAEVVGHDSIYRVKKGDSLYTIARHHGLAVEHLAFANHLPVQLEVAAGKFLVIPGAHILPAQHPPTGLWINLPERAAYLFRDGKFVGYFPLAIGRAGFETPTGHFKIVSMVKNPTWLPPEWAGKGETVVPAGPDNPLGDRWIGLNSPGLGMHATIDPLSVGDNASHGCMRMYPPMTHKLFEMVHKGMPVWIEYRPVKLGKGVLQVFPDVYGRGMPSAASLGLPNWIAEHELDHPSGRVLDPLPGWMVRLGAEART